MKRVILVVLAVCLVVAGYDLTNNNDNDKVAQVVTYNHIQEQEVTSNTAAPVLHDVSNQVMSQLTK